MSWMAKELAQSRLESQRPHRPDIEHSKFPEWIGFRLYLRPEPGMPGSALPGEMEDDCLVEFVHCKLISLEAWEITPEDFGRIITKVKVGMLEEPDLRVYAQQVMRSEHIPLASETYIELAEVHGLHGDKAAPDVDKGARFARVFLAHVMSTSYWETHMTQHGFVSRWVNGWWQNPSVESILNLIRESYESANAYDTLLWICLIAVEQDKRGSLPRELLEWFLGASLGRPNKPDPKPASPGRPRKVGYQLRENEIRNTVRLLKAVGFSDLSARRAVVQAFPHDITMRTALRVCKEPYWTPEDIASDFSNRFQVNSYLSPPRRRSDRRSSLSP